MNARCPSANASGMGITPVAREGDAALEHRLGAREAALPAAAP
jgi:hypothetical protein